MKPCGCDSEGEGPYKIRGYNLCKDHYIEALEHSADFTFDAVELSKVLRIPPILVVTPRVQRILELSGYIHPDSMKGFIWRGKKRKKKK